MYATQGSDTRGVVRTVPVRIGFLWCFAVLPLLFPEPCALADELVQIAPHRAAGSVAPAVGTPPLFGYLARPQQRGRSPAVVVLHGCNGFSIHEIGTAATLKGWGYVTLALDSLGDAVTCGDSAGAAAETSDAYAALQWLAAQDFVDADGVAVIGYSMGGSAVLNSVEQGPVESAQPRHFRAAIAYYPYCGVSNGVMTIPTLILVGERDDWTPAATCRKMAAHESDIGIRRHGGGVPVQLVVYPGVTHAFDWRVEATTYLGHAVVYDADAARDAEARVRAFLHDVLSNAPATAP
jgi:dienelactone hydrolase